eukprot:5630849-Prymnesium_polylepis.2
MAEVAMAGVEVWVVVARVTEVVGTVEATKGWVVSVVHVAVVWRVMVMREMGVVVMVVVVL